MKYRLALFDEHDRLQKDAPFLDQHLADMMESRLSLLFKSVDGAYTKEARPSAVREAESRHDFDAMFNNFYVDEVQQVTSPEVL